MYQRKTKDVYYIMSNYGYGWEAETQEDTYKEARETLKTYKENTSGQHKILMKRERIT